MYKGAGGGNYASSSVLRSTPPDASGHGDWSWKPGPGEEGRPDAWFREKLRERFKTMTKRELVQYFRKQADYLDDHQARLSEAERIHDEQLEGYEDTPAGPTAK
jgi:hypothetical protein